MDKSLTLILGGARSGKSAYAQQLAMAGKKVLFVATAEPLDPEMQARIQKHRDSRPREWDTLEEPVSLPTAIAPILHDYDTVLLDCITLWVSNLLLASPDISSTRQEIRSKVEALLQVYEQGYASWIVVSNEVGLGVIPGTELGRIYADELGRVNQTVAAHAGTVYFMAAGLPMTLKAKDPGDC